MSNATSTSTQDTEKGSIHRAPVAVPTTNAHDDPHHSISLPPFGGEFQPGPYYYQPQRKFANPAPLGLCAFALTTFILSLINANTRGVSTPNIVVGAAYAYGGLIQLLAGMWEMAVGNTFGATALSSYGGFWISWAIIETKSFGITAAYENPLDLTYALGYYLIAWWIFTTLLLFCTFKSTLAFFSLFFFLDITFLLLAIAHLHLDDGAIRLSIQHAAGVFGLITAFIAWWNALAGIADGSNSFFIIPVVHFPWSGKKVEDKRVPAVMEKERTA
ncbi:GPR1/FUN34/yaaH family-domain-containing protein [Kalaharituber pfeilii]|nr:GPR1/FUN34/yaaH family-domain-containing protein [Kalaharituber pfeilii]